MGGRGQRGIARRDIAETAHEHATGDTTPQRGCLAGAALTAAMTGAEGGNTGTEQEPEIHDHIILSGN